MAKSVNAIDTPCVGICSTVYGDEICRGCKRHYLEIIQWNTFDSAKKQTIFQRLSQKMSVVVSEYLIIQDEDLLRQQLDILQIRYHFSDDAFCYAHHLLRALQDKPQDLSFYGIALKPEYQQYSLRELFTLMDLKLYSQSA